MDTTMKLAIEAYCELSGMNFKEVAEKCLVEGPVQRSVMMLMFAAR